MLLGVWDVSKSALVNEEFQGLIKLTYLTTAIQVSGVLFVGLLPEYKEDLERMKTMRGGSSKVGGAIFIFITFSSIAYAISVGLLNIIAPGWMGESWHRTANSHNNTALVEPIAKFVSTSASNSFAKHSVFYLYDLHFPLPMILHSMLFQ